MNQIKQFLIENKYFTPEQYEENYCKAAMTVNEISEMLADYRKYISRWIFKREII